MGASVAYGDEVTGPVKDIDMTASTFEAEGKLFIASPHHAVGPELSAWREGETVTVSYETPGATAPPCKAMAITQDNQ
jgi:hypothetical protein